MCMAKIIWDKMSPSAQNFFKSWLRGTTCYHRKRSVEWISECGQYILLKHHGHSEYIGRWSPPVWCGTCYYLYNVNDRVDTIGVHYLWKKEGRWKKSCIEEIKRIVLEDIKERK